MPREQHPPATPEALLSSMKAQFDRVYAAKTPQEWLVAWANYFGSRVDAEAVVRMVGKLEKRYLDEDVWGCFFQVARETYFGYLEHKGKSFLALLRKNLLSRLARCRKRTRQRDGKRWKALEGLARPHHPEEVARVWDQRRRQRSSKEAKRHWSYLLLHQVLGRLDPKVQTAVLVRLANGDAKEVADALDVKVQTVWKRYSEPKLTALVKAAVRSLVAGLRPDLRRLLVRHLLGECGLSLRQVGGLLQVSVEPADAPLLREPDLLVTLVWAT